MKVVRNVVFDEIAIIEYFFDSRFERYNFSKETDADFDRNRSKRNVVKICRVVENRMRKFLAVAA